MDELTPIAAVRKRPGMFVGNTDDGSGIINLVLDIVGNAYDQYLAGRCSRIAVAIASDGAIAVDDDGPGIPAAALDSLLTQLSTQPTVDGHRPHVHIGRGGMGLCVVNALSERFELVSVHAGVEAKMAYARGELVERVATTRVDRPSGTAIRFRPDPTIFNHIRVSRSKLTEVLEDLSFLSPRLDLRWSFDGDDLATRGLVARVALAASCAFDDVAHHRESYETPNGPIDVEVALAWRDTGAPSIDSFVNLERTRDHGSHVDGLLDAAGSTDGMVAAVSVVLADVIYGEPRKDRLASPHARAPVCDATRHALVNRRAPARPDRSSDP